MQPALTRKNRGSGRIARDENLDWIEVVTSTATAKIERLISSNPAYENTPLAKWARENPTGFLSNLSDMREDYPRSLIVATDFLFAIASYTWAEVLEPINQQSVSDRSLDRTCSMQGGFPWTDENFPWPLHFNGAPARPALQLNLQTLGTLLNLPLPNALYQYWGEQIGVRVIPLDDIADMQPDWAFPTFPPTEDPIWPDDDGWLFEAGSDPGRSDIIGNQISLGEKTFEFPDLTLFLDAENFEEPKNWAEDIFVWMTAIGVQPDRSRYLAERLSIDSAEYFGRLQDCLSSFKGVFVKENRRSHKGGFFTKAPYLPGAPYHNLVLQGLSCFYEPGRLSDQKGLSFHDARVLGIMKSAGGPIPALDQYEDVEIGFFHASYNAEGKADFPLP